jgi:hypothetical protein
MDDWMGRVFEAICRSYVGGQSEPFIPDRVGRWWSGEGSAKVDVVALGPGEMLIAECKWGRVDASDLEQLRRNGARLAGEISADRRGDRPLKIHEALFSGRGEFSPSLRRTAGDQGVRLIGPGDLYPDATLRRGS